MFVLLHWAEHFSRGHQLCNQSTSNILCNPKVRHRAHIALHWSLSRAISIQSIPPHHISPISILILSTYLPLGIPSGLFPPPLDSTDFLFSSETRALQKQYSMSSISQDTKQCSPLKDNQRFKRAYCRTCYILQSGFLFGLFFDSEDGSDMFLRNLDSLLM
jgi:hypothetical protein